MGFKSLLLLGFLNLVRRTESESVSGAATSCTKVGYGKSSGNRQELDCGGNSSGQYFLRQLKFSWTSNVYLKWGEPTDCSTIECSMGCIAGRNFERKNTDVKESIVLNESVDVKDLECSVDGEYMGAPTGTKFTCVTTGWSPAVPADLCRSCEQGSGYDAESRACVLCKTGEYKERETGTCTSCPRGTISRTEGAEQCEVCPAGHTTYKQKGAGNECYGPVLYGWAEDETFRVGHEMLGNLAEGIRKWSSVGEWWLYKEENYEARKSYITERFTTGYARNTNRKISKQNFAKSVEPRIEDVYCWRYGSAKSYKGYLQTSASGVSCSSYCRSKEQDSEPVCTNGESCDVPECVEVSETDTCDSSTTYVTELHVVPLDAGSTYYVHKTLVMDLDNAKHNCNQLGYLCTGVVQMVHGDENKWKLINTRNLPTSTSATRVLVKLKDEKCQPDRHFAERE